MQPQVQAKFNLKPGKQKENQSKIKVLSMIVQSS